MKIRYKAILSMLAAIYVWSFPASAQQPSETGLDRQIEVSRNYSPELGYAEKLDFMPVVTDTVSLKPEIDYAIVPTIWKGAFNAKPISPARINTERYVPERPFFLRAGLGGPWQTLFDLYASTAMRGDVFAGVYFNHYGRWADVINDEGQKKAASISHNSLGAYLDKRFGRRLLTFNFDDDHRYYTPMGYYTTGTINRKDGSISYNNMAAKITFGDSFTDFSRFNYNIGAYFSNFNNFNNSGQNDIEVFANTGWGIYDGVFTLSSLFHIMSAGLGFGNTNTAIDYSDWRVGIRPDYAFGFKDLRMSMGLNFVYNKHEQDSNFHIFPNVKILYDGLKAMIPYLYIDGSLEDGSFRTLSYSNPYIDQRSFEVNPSRYGLKAGAYGTLLTGAVSYDVFASANFWNDYISFVNTPQEDGFFWSVSNNSVSVFSLGGKLNWMIINNLVLDAGVKFNAASKSSATEIRGLALEREHRIEIGLPGFELSAGLKYSYMDKFFIEGGITVTGKRTYTQVDNNANGTALVASDNELPATVNLKLEAEYKVGRRFNIFLRGDNLLDQRIYEYNRYPGLGINFMAGVKVHF